MATTLNIRIRQISPTTEDGLPSIIAQFIDLRLYGLKESPASFATKYEDAINYPASHWEKYLLDGRDRTFVAELTDSWVSPDSGTRFEAGLWIGAVTALGPYPLDSSTESTSPWIQAMLNLWSTLRKDMDTKNTDLYHWAAVYVRDGFRGRGIASQMIQQSMEKSQEATVPPRKALFTILTKLDNSRALALYQKCGFKVVTEFNAVPYLLEAGHSAAQGLKPQDTDMHYALDILMDTAVPSLSG